MNPARRGAATAVALATAGTLLNAVTLPASAATTCASPVYKRMFYANTTFSGTPKKTDCDTVVDQNWTGAPVTGLPKDNFGVRWTVTRDFGSGGPFTFAVSGTDGIRVYLDGVRKVDLWSNTSGTRAKTVNVTVPSRPVRQAHPARRPRQLDWHLERQVRLHTADFAGRRQGQAARPDRTVLGLLHR